MFGRRRQRGQAAADVGRDLQRNIAQHLRHFFQRGIIGGIGRGILAGEAGKLSHRPLCAAAQLEVGIGEGEEIADRPLDHPVAVIMQLHVGDDFGAQQADGVAGGGVAEAGVELLGHRRAADHVPPFQHPHLQPRLGEVESADEAIVAAADNQGVIGIGHALLQPDGGGKGWRASGISARIFAAKLRRQTSLVAIGPWP